MASKKITIYRETGDPQVLYVNSDKECRPYEEMPFKPNSRVVQVIVEDA